MTIHARTPHPCDLPRISYAQNAEDILIDRLFSGTTGTYMDIGSCHPLIDSNSLFFYERGWRGVNIEPAGASFQLFLNQRSEDLNLNVAASDCDGELTFYEVEDQGINGISTLSPEIARGYRSRGFKVSEKNVLVRTVRRLVQEYALEPPEFLSIDVETHEHQVIAGIDLAAWRPKLIVVESTVPCSTETNYHSWEPMILEHDYRFVAFNGLNRFYLRDDLHQLAKHFETPVNVFDDYYPYTRVRAEQAAAELRRELEQARMQCERARLESRKQASQVLRLHTAHSDLVRHEVFLQHQCRHLENQRDLLGAEVDELRHEIAVLGRELAALRTECPERSAAAPDRGDDPEVRNRRTQSVS
jgi:FkbM family methyltransferase